jgi:hypothetical protein
MGENVTFSCTTSSYFLIWEVRFIDRTIGSIRYLFDNDDAPGRINSEAIPGVHVYSLLVSKTNGILDSILVARTSASLESAVVECEGREIRRLTFRFACKCRIILLSPQYLLSLNINASMYRCS